VDHGVEGCLLDADAVVVEEEAEIVDYLEYGGVFFSARLLDEAYHKVLDLR